MLNHTRNFCIASVILLCSTFLSACAYDTGTVYDSRMSDGQFIIQVNSLAAPDIAAAGKRYYIASAMQQISEDDLQFMEFARYVENALTQQGFQRVAEQQEADQLIRLGYGIGAPETTSHTYTTSAGYSYPVGWMWFSVPATTETVATTTYRRNLILEAYDLKNPQRKSQIWKTSVQSTGTSNDLRIVLAYMLAAAQPHLATNTGQQLELQISGYDQRVLAIWN